MPDNNELHIAAQEGDLVQLQSQVNNFDINAKGEQGGTALYWSARNGHVEAFKLLFTFNPDVNIPDVSTLKALTSTVSTTLVTIVSPLCRLNWQRFFMQLTNPFLYMLIWCSQKYKQKISITHHPPPLSIYLQQSGNTALMHASSSGLTEAVKLLLTAPGIDVNHANVSLYLLIPPYLVL